MKKETADILKIALIGGISLYGISALSGTKSTGSFVGVDSGGLGGSSGGGIVATTPTAVPQTYATSTPDFSSFFADSQVNTLPIDIFPASWFTKKEAKTISQPQFKQAATYNKDTGVLIDTAGQGYSTAYEPDYFHISTGSAKTSTAAATTKKTQKMNTVNKLTRMVSDNPISSMLMNEAKKMVSIQGGTA